MGMNFPSDPVNDQIFEDWIYNATKGTWDKRGVSAAGYLLGAIYPWTAPNLPAWGLELAGQTIVGGVALYSGIAALNPAWCVGADLVLPDWRGRTPVGYKAGDSLFGTLGALVGTKEETISNGQLPVGSVLYGAGSSFYVPISAGNSSNAYRAKTHASPTEPQVPINNVQPSVVVRWVVCAVSSSGNFDTEVQTALVSRVTILENKSGIEKITPSAVVNTGGSFTQSGNLITWSGCSALRIDGFFGADFDNYIADLISLWSTIAGVAIYGRLGIGSTITAAGYSFAGQYSNLGGTISGWNGSAAAAFDLARTNTAIETSIKTHIITPFLMSHPSRISWDGYFVDASNRYRVQAAGSLVGSETTQYTSLYLFPSSGTFSGRMKLYGYK